jgi:hypothetical protein
VSGDEQDGRRPLGSEPDQVGADHHRAPREPVGEHPADQQERDERHGARGEHVAEVGRAPGQVENRERESDGRDRIAELRDDLPGEEQTKVALVENAEARPAHRDNLVD